MRPLTVYKRVLKNIKRYNPDLDEDLFDSAYFFAKEHLKGIKMHNGDPFLCHPLKTTYRLTELKLSEETLIASIIHDVDISKGKIREDCLKKFGKSVVELVDGVKRLEEIKYLPTMGEKQIDSIKKLFLSLSDDLRVVLIKMATRLHYLEILDSIKDSKERLRLGKETLDIYAPLADALGVWEFKWRLEDMSFRFVYPKEYFAISSEVTESKSKMESYIRRVKNVIEKTLKDDGLPNVIISGRVKNLYSIYKKIVFKNKNLDEIYDIVAIRIILEDTTDCYRVLGIIHNMWRPLTHRIKDYIAVPKMNGYKSLHTTVFCIDNHLCEIQIRTESMHEEAEFGLASHLSYADKKISVAPEGDKRQWVSCLKNLKINERSEIDHSIDEQQIKVDVFGNHIFVFTPRGNILDLPKDSTPIDFAFMVHTSLGYNYNGAKVNGKMVSANTKLQNGDVIEIISNGNSSGPKREWLSFIKTSKAKTKIKAHLKRLMREASIRKGRESFEKELKKYGKKLNHEKRKIILASFPYLEMEDVYVAISEGALSLSQVLKKVIPDIIKEGNIKEAVIKDTSSSTKSKVVIEGEQGYKIRMSKCCNPEASDLIFGYVTIGKGITIHRKDCHFAQKADNKRVLKACWK